MRFAKSRWPCSILVRRLSSCSITIDISLVKPLEVHSKLYTILTHGAGRALGEAVGLVRRDGNGNGYRAAAIA